MTFAKTLLWFVHYSFLTPDETANYLTLRVSLNVLPPARSVAMDGALTIMAYILGKFKRERKTKHNFLSGGLKSSAKSLSCNLQ